MKKNKKIIDILPSEKVLKVIHHYFLTLLPNLIVCFLIFILNFFLMFYLFSIGTIGVAVFFATMLVVIYYVIRLLFLWNNNLVVITDQRVIDCERSGFFHRLTTEIKYDKIRTVTVKVDRLSQKIFKYGDLNLEIIGEPMGFVLYNIKRPVDVLQLINAQLTGQEMGHPSLEDKEVNSNRDSYDFDELIYHLGRLSDDKKKKVYQFLKKDLERENEYESDE